MLHPSIMPWLLPHDKRHNPLLWPSPVCFYDCNSIPCVGDKLVAHKHLHSDTVYIYLDSWFAAGADEWPSCFWKHSGPGSVLALQCTLPWNDWAAFAQRVVSLLRFLCWGQINIYRNRNYIRMLCVHAYLLFSTIMCQRDANFNIDYTSTCD